MAKPGRELLPVNATEVVYNDSPDGVSFDTLTTTFEEGREAKSERIILLFNVSYTCRLRGEGKSGQLVLTEPPQPPAINSGRNRSADSSLRHRLVWFAPAGTYQLSDLINPLLTVVTKVEWVEGGLVRLDFAVKPGLSRDQLAEVRGVTKGSLLLNMRWHYRLEEAVIDYDPKTQHQTVFKVQYLEKPGEEHLMAGLVADTKILRPGDLSAHSFQQVREFENLPPTDDPSIFYMSHYGLPEPEGVTAPTKPIPLWVWLLIAAAVFAVTAVGIRVVLRRRTRTTTQPVPPPVG